MASSPQFNMSLLQAIAIGKCLKYCGKKCWEWTIQEERKHREIEKYERQRERILEQFMIFKQQEEQEKIRKEKEAMNDDDDDDDDYDDVLEILKNINIDEIIKEFQIKNKN